VSLFVLSPEIEDRDEVEVANWVNHKKIGHLTRSSRLWTFQLLGFEVFQVRLQKKPTSTISIEINFTSQK
jgi:hypothetical protein